MRKELGWAIKLLIFILINSNLSAQVDSTRPYLIGYELNDLIFFSNKNDTLELETSLHNLQNKWNRTSLGNIGLPSNNSSPIKLNYSNNDLGTRMKPLFYSQTIDEVEKKYLKTNKIFTSVFASAGQRKEQVLSLIHAQRINENNNVSLFFDRYSSQGYFQNQLSFVNDLLISGFGTDKKNQSGYYSSFNFRKIKHQENGGIVEDSILEENPSIRKDLLQVNLSQAKRTNRDFSFFLNPWFFIRKLDSTSNFTHKVSIKTCFSITTSQYQDNPQNYFYEFIFKDSLKTNDSLSFKKLKNEFNYEFAIRKNAIKIQIAISQESSEYFNSDRNTYLNNYIFSQKFSKSAQKNTLHIFQTSQLVFDGFSKGDCFVNANALKSYSNIVFNVSASLERRTPDLFMLNFSGNNFSWINKFQKIDLLTFSSSIKLKKYNSGIIVAGRLSKNEVYFNENSLPSQYNSGLAWIQGKLFNNLKFWKFKLNTDLNYNLMSDQDILLQPSLTMNNQLYFESKLFRENLAFQFGFQTQFYSRFYPYAYNPSLNLFEIQSANENPGYLFLDVFLNFKISPVSFFIKWDHVNQSISKPNYYLSPGYYQNDRMLRFGLNWIFND